MKKKYLLTFAFIFLIGTVAVLATVLLLGTSKRAATPMLPENSAEAAPPAITLIEIQNGSMQLEPGDIKKLNIVVQPAGADINSLNITSSNSSIVRIVDGSVEAMAEGKAMIFVSSKNGISSSCSVNVETPYEIKDERNIGYHKLSNGEILEYCCEYKDYALKVHNMTSYQRENRTFEKDGLYAHIKGPVYKVDDAGVVYIDLGAAEDNLFSPALFANITLEDCQSNLLMQLNKGDSIEVFAKLNEGSYNAAITTVSFELFDGIIVNVNSRKTTIPQDFKPRPFDPYGGSDDIPDFDPNGIGPNGYPWSNPPTEGYDTQDRFPCTGTYEAKNGTSVTIDDFGNGVLWVTVYGNNGALLYDDYAYYDTSSPYSFFLFIDGNTLEICSYKPDYSIMLTMDVDMLYLFKV